MVFTIAAAAVVLCSLGVLALVCVRTWRGVKEFARSVSVAGDKVAAATAALETAQRDRGA